jgi:hypothetical protein
MTLILFLITLATGTLLGFVAGFLAGASSPDSSVEPEADDLWSDYLGAGEPPRGDGTVIPFPGAARRGGGA